MQRTKAQGFIDQAEAMVDAYLRTFRYKPGEYPDIEISQCVGKATDFLRKSGVPAKGSMVHISVILTLEVPGKESIVDQIPIQESYPIATIRDLLRKTVDDFFMNHGKMPDQEIKHKVVFLLDETQLED